MSYRNQAQKDLQARIADKRAEASRLENERHLSAQQAVENVARAKQLRADGDWLERNYNSHDVQAWLVERESTLQLQDDHKARAAQEAFSALQNELIGMEDMQRERIQDAMNAVVYNGAIGIDRRTLERQIARLINGEGQTDTKGNRYVVFTEGSNSASYRAVVTPDGAYGFVLAGRGDTSWGE